jgi:hypothetical protein
MSTIQNQKGSGSGFKSPTPKSEETVRKSNTKLLLLRVVQRAAIPSVSVISFRVHSKLTKFHSEGPDGATAAEVTPDYMERTVIDIIGQFGTDSGLPQLY